MSKPVTVSLKSARRTSNWIVFSLWSISLTPSALIWMGSLPTSKSSGVYFLKGFPLRTSYAIQIVTNRGTCVAFVRRLRRYPPLITPNCR
jgi:hypothetical protein